MKKAQSQSVPMLTVAEYAAKHDVGAVMVQRWLSENRLEGAEKEPLPFANGSKFIWRIPANAPRPERGKPGPKRGTKKAAKGESK